MDSKVFFHVSKLETLGDRMIRPSARKIARRPYREFEYMPELQNKKISLKDICKKMYADFKDILKAVKPEKP